MAKYLRLIAKMAEKPLVFRTAGLSDVDKIAALHTESWRVAYANVMRPEYLAGVIVEERKQTWTQRFAEQSGAMQVKICEREGELLGFVATFAPDDNTLGALLDNLHVKPNAKRQGLGKLLLKASADWVANHFPDTGLHLWVLKSNEAAQQFYKRLGGVIVDESIDRLPDGTMVPEYCYRWDRAHLLL